MEALEAAWSIADKYTQRAPILLLALDMSVANKLPRWWPYAVVMLMALPLFFVNVFNSHDWGGDFAQYIAQAMNMADGIPQAETGYIYNPLHPFLAPPAYPVGYPLMLLPVYLVAGNNILAFTLFTNVLIVLYGMLAFRFFRKHFGLLIALLMTAVLIWHPWLLRFKMEIRSDVPFALFFLLFLWLYEQRDKKNALRNFLLGMLGGFIITIRTIGAVVFIAVIVRAFIQTFRILRKKSDRKIMDLARDYGAIFMGIVGGYYLLSTLIFPMPSASHPYPNLFASAGLGEILLANLEYYFGLFRYYFAPPNQSWMLGPHILSWAAFVFFVVGFVREFQKGFKLRILLFLGYMGVLMLFPYQASGLRFLLPVMPLVLYFIARGIQWPGRWVNLPKKMVAPVLAGMMLCTFVPGWLLQLKYQNRVIDGPQSAYAQECFEFIRTQVPEDAIMAFEKPRVLALYANRKAMSSRPGQSMGSITNNFNEFGVNYYVWHTEVSNEAFQEWINLHHNELEEVFSNEKMKVFRKQL